MATQPDTESEFDGRHPRHWRNQPRDEDLGYETADWERVEGDDGKYRFLPADYDTGDRHPMVKVDDNGIVDLANHV